MMMMNDELNSYLLKIFIVGQMVSYGEILNYFCDKPTDAIKVMAPVELSNI